MRPPAARALAALLAALLSLGGGAGAAAAEDGRYTCERSQSGMSNVAPGLLPGAPARGESNKHCMEVQEGRGYRREAAVQEGRAQYMREVQYRMVGWVQMAD